jgi:hypothetical protein
MRARNPQHASNRGPGPFNGIPDFHLRQRTMLYTKVRSFLINIPQKGNALQRYGRLPNFWSTNCSG